jgi:5-formyltetrahydrofolate cyclo-ligase
MPKPVEPPAGAVLSSEPLAPDVRAVFADKARRQLRARMRSLRLALPEAAVLARSARIVERLLALPLVEQARSVALFWPVQRNAEVDLRALDATLEARGVARYYPFMDPSVQPSSGVASFRTGFRRVASAGALLERGRGFAEPPPDEPAAARGDIELIIVPALAATPAGARLGYGAGFYDATLPDHRPPARALVVAFAFQLVGELPLLGHDVACDGVVTDDAVYLAGGEP